MLGAWPLDGWFSRPSRPEVGYDMFWPRYSHTPFFRIGGARVKGTGVAAGRPAVAVCIKAAHLRKMTPRAYDNLIAWRRQPNHLYVGRGERVTIKTSKGKKKVVGIKASKWHNPFTVKKYGLDKALRLYRQHLYADRGDGTRLIDEIDELRGKVLGCWCTPGEPCHAQILVDELARRP